MEKHRKITDDVIPDPRETGACQIFLLQILKNIWFMREQNGIVFVVESLSLALYVKRQTPGKEKFFDIRQ
jgi:hypothetical protein